MQEWKEWGSSSPRPLHWYQALFKLFQTFSWSERFTTPEQEIVDSIEQGAARQPYLFFALLGCGLKFNLVKKLPQVNGRSWLNQYNLISSPYINSFAKTSIAQSRLTFLFVSILHPGLLSGEVSENVAEGHSLVHHLQPSKNIPAPPWTLTWTYDLEAKGLGSLLATTKYHLIHSPLTTRTSIIPNF